MKNLLNILLFLLFATGLFSQNIIIKGKIFDPEGKPVIGASIRVEHLPENVLMYENIVQSDREGNFLDSVPIPDSIEKGSIVLAWKSCEGKALSQRQKWSRDNLNLFFKLQTCKTDQAKCSVRIERRQTATGIFLVAIGRGIMPFHFKWDDGTIGPKIRYSSDRINYCVEMVDSVGCKAKACISDIAKCEVKIVPIRSDSVGHVKLLGLAKGRGKKILKWSTGDTTRAIWVKPKGEYCLKMQDEAGCTAFDCFSFDSLRDCHVEIRRLFPRQLIAIPKGIPPFSFSWSNGESTSHIKIDSAGEYCVKISDALGCESHACLTIDSIYYSDCKVEIKQTPSNVLHAQASGSHPFRYEWSSGETTKSIHAPRPGVYCVKVTDVNGCSSRSCVEVFGDSDKCRTSIVVIPQSISKVKLLAKVSPTGPFKLQWEDGSTDKMLVVSKSGIYCVKTINAENCVSGDCVEIRFNKIIDSLVPSTNKPIDKVKNELTKNKTSVNSINKIKSKVSKNNSINEFKILQNPADNELRLKGITKKGGGALRIFDVLGNILKVETIDTEGPFTKTIDLSGYRSGIYLVQLESGTNYITKRLILK